MHSRKSTIHWIVPKYAAYKLYDTTWNISRKQELSEKFPELVSSGDSKEISQHGIHASHKSCHFSYANKVTLLQSLSHGPYSVWAVVKYDWYHKVEIVHSPFVVATFLKLTPTIRPRTLFDCFSGFIFWYSASPNNSSLWQTPIGVNKGFHLLTQFTDPLWRSGIYRPKRDDQNTWTILYGPYYMDHITCAIWYNINLHRL